MVAAMATFAPATTFCCLAGRVRSLRTGAALPTICARVVAAMALAAVFAGTTPARAEPGYATPQTAPPVQPDHEVTLHVGYAVHYMMAGSAALFAGPKLTLEYAQRTTDHLWLDASLGLISGSCWRQPDENSCALEPGYAIEPLVGIRLKTAGNARAFAYAKFVAGALVVVPDKYPVGAAALFRAGGGAKVFVSDTGALGLEITGALGFGRFELYLQPAQHVTLNADLGLGIEARF